MGFQQLYYTSCTNGLAGYGGYQFNAATPGVSPVVMREVENRTVYEPPRGLPAEPRPEELADYPVAFSYTTGGATGAAITAHVVFVGADYSGRPGNYFAHALVTDSPEADFGPLLPAELWGAALWRREPVERRELPELSGPPPRGPIDRAGTQAFLDARAADGVLPALLSAVDRAMTGDRAVLLAGHDAAENAWWIAAISYLLGDRLARRLSFTTYSHRPGYSGHHVVGVVNEPGSAPAGADLGFHLFDVTTGRLPDGLEVHPLAELLTRVGVMSSAALWQQAAALATGAEADFTGWYPPVAAAAALLGVEPTVTDVDLIAGWLVTADRPPGRHADVVLGVVLARPDDLGDARLRELLDLAVRLNAGGRVERIERLLIDRALGRLGRGEPAEPARLSTPGNRAAAARRCRELLVAAAPGRALTVLEWSEASGAGLPEETLETYGRDALGPATPGDLLRALLRGRPAVLRGLLARLAEGPEAAAEAVFQGPAAELIGRAELTRHPGLAELWLLGAARQGRLPPIRVFDEIVEVRSSTGRAPLVDVDLLSRLWPGGCPAAELTELLGVLHDRAANAPAIRSWFAEAIAGALRGEEGEAVLVLAQTVTRHPIRTELPEDVRRIAVNLHQLQPLLRRAPEEVAAGELKIFGSLYGSYARAGTEVRKQLDRELPLLLVKAEPLDQALYGCPGPVFGRFCEEAHRRLRFVSGDHALAARVFAAWAYLEEGSAAQIRGLEAILAPMAGWKRADLRSVAKRLQGNEELARLFDQWREDHRSGPVAVVRRLARVRRGQRSQDM